jgi:hypothetical protein
MKNAYSSFVIKLFFLLFFVTLSCQSFAQQQSIPSESKSDFWDNVQFGGGIGLSAGSGYTDITVAPSAIYNFNEYFSAGVSLLGTYVSSKNYYNSLHYGGSLVTLFNPIEEIQLSVELEQIRVNNEYKSINGNFKDNFWNTGLFLGAGYRTGSVTIGARYNILYNRNKNVYNEAFMPFVRIFF